MGEVRRKVNFGKMIKQEEEKDPLLRVIDEASLESYGKFSKVGIKKSLKNMIRELDKDDFNRDDFFKEYHKMTGLVMAPDVRATGCFHPSSLEGDCPRMLYYELSGEPPTDSKREAIPAQLMRIFDVGTWYHLYIQNGLYVRGALKASEVVVRDKEKFIDGKADGVLEDWVYGKEALLEIKTMNSYSFSRAIFGPFKKHLYQASIYASELGIELIAFVYINKDTSEVRVFCVNTDGSMVEHANSKMESVIKSVKLKKIPDKVCSDCLSEQAVRCPYKSKCFK